MSENRTIKTWRDPYGIGFNTTSARKVIFTKGITTLVGCNGAGKTTLLNNIKTELEKDNTPVFHYSDREESTKLFDRAAFENDWEFVVARKSSSEGENITLNLGKFLPKLRKFIQSGENPNKRFNPFASLSDNKKDEKTPVSNERWLLFDAVDSGFSIDNMLDLKQIFNQMLDDAKRWGVDLYIIISANAYEFVNNENCLDVMTGKNKRFESYDDYKNFVIKTREKKDIRYKKLEEKRGKEKS